MVRQVKKIVLLALVLMLAMPAIALAQDPVFPSRTCYGPKISDDLDAQDITLPLKAEVKVHPALQVCIDNNTASYPCLNPATNQSATLTWTVGVRSNLPFHKLLTMKSQFTYDDDLSASLQSWHWTLGPNGFEWFKGSWLYPELPGHGDSICPGGGKVMYRDNGYGVDCNGVGSWTGWTEWAEATYGDPTGGTNLAYGAVMPQSGSIGLGDIDHHTWVEEITYETPEIDWCVTAGFYKADFELWVAQN